MRSASQKQTREEEVIRLKEQGRQYLKTNQIGKALRIFSTVLKEHPDDIDAMLILGDSYLLAGEQAYALVLYQQAYQLAPDRRDIKRRITILQTSAADLSIPDLIPTHPRAIAELIRHLTGQVSQVTPKELEQAGHLLEQYLRSSSPAQAVAEHLDEINNLLPALIELNMHQARSDGRIDVADALQEMLTGMLLQGDLQDPTVGLDQNKAEPRKKKQILMGGVSTNESPYRLLSIKQMLSDADFDLVALNGTQPDEMSVWEHFDLVIVHNPHASPIFMRGIGARAAANLPVLVDLAVDFSHLPVNHPDLITMGLDDPLIKRAYQASLQLASCISVPSQAFAQYLQQSSYPVEIMPDGWNQYDFLWTRPFHNSSFFNLGLNLIPGQINDVVTLRRAVTRVIREFPHTRLVISGDLDVYQMFDNLPDSRKLFLPPVEIEDYPYMLARMDLLLVPMQDGEYNHHRSDRRLMEAGVRRIPWIASPVPAHMDWGSGGLIAASPDEWHLHLQTLIQDSELRQKLGQSGYQKALQRESQVLSKAWVQLVQRLVNRQVE